MSRRDSLCFLGTGAGDCVEMRGAAGRTEVDPRKTGAKDARHAPGLWIGPDLLIDRFSDERLRACGIHEDDIRHLLISHAHQDHFQPLTILELVRRRSSRPSHGLTVHGNGTVRHALEFALAHRWNGRAGVFQRRTDGPEIPVTEVAPGTSFDVWGIRVTAVPASHCIDKKNMIQQEQALNFVLERGGKTLFYGLDSSYLLPQAREILSGFRLDVAIMDATFGPMKIDPVVSGHHNFAMLDETLEQLRQAGTVDEDTVVVADHISYDAVQPHDEIAGPLAERGITLAFDGMTLPW